ncbi:hypothetical protein V8C37DRAFT_417130 [Trichoderma ceciliae]
MSQNRKIDEIPNVLKKSNIKVIVLSCSKTGTLGLYRAFKILGYKPYHAAEFIRSQDHTHKILFQEALEAEHNHFSGIKPYERTEFDKWFKDYDVIIEVSSYMPLQINRAYLDDPNVKFLLTEREPDKWAKSFNRQVGHMNDYLASIPISILRHFDKGLWYHWHFNALVYGLFSGMTKRGHPENEQILRQSYINYNNLVKILVPKERLRVIKLEEGLGWGELCDFLEISAPDMPYPNFDNHLEMVDELVGSLVKRALLKFMAVVMPMLGVGMWLTWRRWKK